MNLTPEERARRSDWMRENVLPGRPWEAEHRAGCSCVRCSPSTNGFREGHRHRPETIEKLRAAARDRPPWTDEQRRAQSERLKGRTFSREHRARLAASVHSPAAVAAREARKAARRARESTSRRDDVTDVSPPFPITSPRLRCIYCDRYATAWDHVIPYCQGGRATEDNLEPACRRCNNSKSGRTPAQWLAAGLYAS